MKKLIAWTLLLAMVLAVFAGCNNNDTPATAESLIGDAKSYVYNMYKDKAGKASRDFKLVGVVKVGEFSYDIAWTTDAAEENVKIGAAENGIVTVDVNEDYAEDAYLPFTLTDTLTAGSKTETVVLNYFIPGNFVYITGSCQPKRWDPNSYEFVINDVRLLSEVKENAIKSITLSMKIEELNDGFVEDLMQYIEKNPGQSKIYFNIRDTEQEFTLSLVSLNSTMNITQQFIDFIKKQPGIEYKLN